MTSAAREAAFGATPDRIPRGARDAEERWLVAVALGGQGHYAAAAAELARLAADPTVPLRLVAHAAVTRAAHLRQLGGHAAARAHDARGLRLATAALRAAAPPASAVAACAVPASAVPPLRRAAAGAVPAVAPCPPALAARRRRARVRSCRRELAGPRPAGAVVTRRMGGGSITRRIGGG